MTTTEAPSKWAKGTQEIVSNTGWLGGSTAAMFGKEETKKWKPNSQKESNEPRSPRKPSNEDWLGGSPAKFHSSPIKNRPKQIEIAGKRGSIKDNPFLKNQQL